MAKLFVWKSLIISPVDKLPPGWEGRSDSTQQHKNSSTLSPGLYTTAYTVSQTRTVLSFSNGWKLSTGQAPVAEIDERYEKNATNRRPWDVLVMLQRGHT